METKSKLTQILLGIIVGVLMIQLAFQFSALLSKFLADKAPAQDEAQAYRLELYQTLYDLAEKRTTAYQNDIYNDPAVDNINKQMERQLEYIFMELNSQTMLQAQEAMGK